MINERRKTKQCHDLLIGGLFRIYEISTIHEISLTHLNR